jgi:thiol-disulfide isomerase/thioredoxin
MILFYLFFTCCAKAGDLSQEIRTYFSELGIEILSDGKAPIFKLETLQGDTLSLENFYGELLILHFWATWCKPCRREMPELEQLHRQLANKPVTILGISIDNENDGLKVENALKEINKFFQRIIIFRKNIQRLLGMGYSYQLLCRQGREAVGPNTRKR